jgi:hypothetical protein
LKFGKQKELSWFFEFTLRIGTDNSTKSENCTTLVTQLNNILQQLIVNILSDKEEDHISIGWRMACVHYGKDGLAQGVFFLGKNLPRGNTDKFFGKFFLSPKFFAKYHAFSFLLGEHVAYRVRL